MKVRTGGRVVEIPDERMAKAEGRSVKEQARVPSGTLAAPSPLPGWPKPTDKWNYAYAQYLELEKHAGRIKWWWYEPIPFGITLGGAEEKLKYRPDFLVWYPDGLERKLEFVEVKGWSRNRRDGITRYKIAAALFPCFDWIMVERKGHGWQEC
jgi:hypothetical protein